MNERTIFLAALDIDDPTGRADYIARTCGGDAALRGRVEELLNAHNQPHGFMEEPAPALITSVESPPTGETPGTMFGRYKLLEPIGEGGYGTVFMAEQTSPVHRKVALKIVKAGMDTKQVIARFEVERQALALMDHPNIAKVHDAGVSETGRPYFVMELVKGVPITKYCDEHRLTPRQRLDLFVQVCQAVQHAHQKGIIHRDLKPTNVLVALYDGKPVPKVIDFGVAKATGQQLTERTMFTGFGDVIGTPQYMSPEQAELNQLDIDTRSDIYSLGVLLYELLTGTTPIEHKRVKEAALLEVLRVIREEEPPKPSARLTTTAELPSIAAQRGLEPKHLAKLVHGELDWIVMKALEKERGRRYETANGLAMDLQRYLHDEPVLACAPSARYRFRKFARRHQTALIATAASFAALLVLVGTLIVSNIRVANERNEKAAALTQREQALSERGKALAEAEAQRRRSESNFLKARVAIRELLASPAIASGEWSALSPQLRKTFMDQARTYYESLVQEDSADPTARCETAIGFRSIGYLHQSAGDYAAAEQSYRRSIEILQGLLRDSPQDTEYRTQMAWVQTLLGETLLATTRPAKAADAYEVAALHYLDLVREYPDGAIGAESFRCYKALLPLLKDEKREQRAEWFLKSVSELPLESASAARVRTDLAGVLVQTGRFPEAERLLRDASAGLHKLSDQGKDVRLARSTVYLRLASAMMNTGRWQEAERFSRQAVALNDNDAAIQNQLGMVLLKYGRLDEALTAFHKAISLLPNNPAVRSNLGKCLLRKGATDEAIAELRKAISLKPTHDSARHSLGYALLEQGLYDQAISELREAIRVNPASGLHYRCLTSALYRQAATRPAAEQSSLRQQAVEAIDGASELTPAQKCALLGWAASLTGDWESTITYYEKAIQLQLPVAEIGAVNWFNLAIAYWHTGDKEKAMQWYGAGVDWMDKSIWTESDHERARAEVENLIGIGAGAAVTAQPRAPRR